MGYLHPPRQLFHWSVAFLRIYYLGIENVDRETGKFTGKVLGMGG